MLLAFASTKSIPCFALFASDLAGSNSNSNASSGIEIKPDADLMSLFVRAEKTACLATWCSSTMEEYRRNGGNP